MTGFETLLLRQRKQEEMSELLHLDMEKMQTSLREIADERQANIQMRLRHYRARQQILSHRILKLVTALESQQHMRTHHGAEPPPSHTERGWAREVRQLGNELQDAGRGRPRLLEISARLQQTRYDGGAPMQDAPLDGGAPGAARLNVDALAEWLGNHQEGLSKLVQVQNELLDDLAVLQQVNG